MAKRKQPKQFRVRKGTDLFGGYTIERAISSTIAEKGEAIGYIDLRTNPPSGHWWKTRKKAQAYCDKVNAKR